MLVAGSNKDGAPHLLFLLLCPKPIFQAKLRPRLDIKSTISHHLQRKNHIKSILTAPQALHPISTFRICRRVSAAADRIRFHVHQFNRHPAMGLNRLNKNVRGEKSASERSPALKLMFPPAGDDTAPGREMIKLCIDISRFFFGSRCRPEYAPLKDFLSPKFL